MLCHMCTSYRDAHLDGACGVASRALAYTRTRSHNLRALTSTQRRARAGRSRVVMKWPVQKSSDAHFETLNRAIEMPLLFLF